jgi:DNA replication protein DnaC
MSAKPKKKVDLDATRGSLEHVGLVHAAESLAEQLTAATRDGTAHHHFLDGLLDVEIRQREERRIATSLRLSGLPTGYTLGNFDWGFQPAIERSRLETLATCAWIREHETLLIQGPPGVGKTHLAVALGVKAIENGFSVAFFRLEDLLHAMKKDAEIPPRRLRGKKYMNVAMVVIDEVGFQTLTRFEAGLLFRLVSYRYERGSTIITTNKPVNEWTEVLAGDEVMTTALLDRLLHRCHVLNIRGRSYRLRDLEKLLKT